MLPEPQSRGRRRRLVRLFSYARKTLLVLAALLVLHVALSAGVYVAMLQPPDVFGRIIAKTPFPLMMVLPFETLWNQARGGRLKPGDLAPDFLLPTLDRKNTVQLSSYRGSRPVVLVFGSYT
jgi:hypothetical protein